MNKEIKYLLEEIKNNTYDYVGTNGCLYQDLSREELNLLLKYINNLEQQCKKQKEVIDKAKSLNHEINHIIYEDFLKENIIGSKFLYERIKKQLSILEDKEVSE